MGTSNTAGSQKGLTAAKNPLQALWEPAVAWRGQSSSSYSGSSRERPVKDFVPSWGWLRRGGCGGTKGSLVAALGFFWCERCGVQLQPSSQQGSGPRAPNAARLQQELPAQTRWFLHDRDTGSACHLPSLGLQRSAVPGPCYQQADLSGSPTSLPRCLKMFL